MTMINEQRPISLEDVQRVIGAMALEIDMLRRENMALKMALAETQKVG